MKRHKRDRPEPTIALINVVFLMLIFFLVAGTIAPPIEGEVALVRTADLDPAAPPDALVIGPDGHMRYRAAQIARAQDYLELAQGDVVRLVPDRALPAAKLIEIGAQLQMAGAKSIVIITRKDSQ